MAEANFTGGCPVEADYTPTSGNVAAGTVVVLTNTCGVAHRDITNNTLGSLAVGGGVYRVVSLSNFAAGTKVYWDDTNNKVSNVSTNNTAFGFLIETPSGANTVAQVLHWPF